MPTHSQISQQALSYSTIFPFGALDNLRLTGTFATDKLADPRSDGYPRVMGLIKKVEEATALSPVATTQGTLPDGVGGFFGLGVYQVSCPIYLRSDVGGLWSDMEYATGAR